MVIQGVLKWLKRQVGLHAGAGQVPGMGGDPGYKK